MKTTSSSQRKAADGDQRQLQGVFKIHGFTRTKANCGEGDGSPQDADAPGTFRPRKSHRKSRMGCGNCKARRVKCDEHRQGGCTTCRSHGIECDYRRTQPAPARRFFQLQAKDCDTSKETLPRPSSQPSPPSNAPSELTGRKEDTTLTPMISLPPYSLLLGPSLDLPANGSSNMTSPLASLHHFESFTSYTFGSPVGQSIIRSCILNLATGTPYLMHAMLGVAAAHMSYLLPSEVNAVQHARNNLADAWHWGRALALFRKELGGDGSLAGASKHNMDGLLSTIMLVAIHQFMLRGEDANLSDNRGSEIWKTSFVFVEDDEERLVAMKWLTIQSGFKMLLGQLERYLAESVWLPVLQDADTQQAFRRLAFISASSKRDTDEVETLLCAICNITNDSTPDNNTYYHTLETVLGVRRLRPVRAELFNKLITVMGRITPELKKLLWMRDVPALLILCHWLSLMAELKQWWLAARSEQECRAIVVYLLAQSSEGDMASQIRRVLCEPAIAVGIRI